MHVHNIQINVQKQDRVSVMIEGQLPTGNFKINNFKISPVMYMYMDKNITLFTLGINTVHPVDKVRCALIQCSGIHGKYCLF